MLRSTIMAALLSISLSLFGVARAESPAMIGLATAGGELGGAALGGFVGLASGVALCRLGASWECYLPMLSTPLGGTVGGIAGASWAAGYAARAQGLEDRRVRRWTAAVGLAGTAITGVGIRLGRDDLALGGVIVGAVGMPLAAAATSITERDRIATAPGRVQLRLTPSAGPGQAALRLDGRF